MVNIAIFVCLLLLTKPEIIEITSRLLEMRDFGKFGNASKLGMHYLVEIVQITQFQNICTYMYIT